MWNTQWVFETYWINRLYDSAYLSKQLLHRNSLFSQILNFGNANTAKCWGRSFSLSQMVTFPQYWNVASLSRSTDLHMLSYWTLDCQRSRLDPKSSMTKEQKSLWRKASAERTFKLFASPLYIAKWLACTSFCWHNAPWLRGRFIPVPGND